MPSRFLYLFGPAGCGKSTIMRRALGEPDQRYDSPVPHMLWPGGVQLGRDRKPDGSPTAFPGVDRIGKGQHAKLLAWLKSIPGNDASPDVGPMDFCAEGQWLAYHRFFDMLEEWGWEVHPIYVAVPREELNRRRVVREQELLREITDGKRAWWRTEDTRFEKLWRQRMCPMIDNTLDGSVELAEHPVIRSIRTGERS